MYTKPVTDKLEELRTSSVIYAVIPVDNNNAFQVAAPSEVDDEWTQHALWGFSKQKVPMPASSGRLHIDQTHDDELKRI